jgi:hypothetical protein
MKPNGNGKAKPSEPVRLSMTEELAIGVAHGSAGAAYEVVSSQHVNGQSKLPNGRWWFCGGEPVERVRGDALVLAMAAFVMDAPTAPPDALMGFVAARLDQRREGISLAERCAFGVFAATLPALMRAARDEQKAQQRALAAPVGLPPQAKGVFRATGAKKRKWGQRVVLEHAVSKVGTVG